MQCTMNRLCCRQSFLHIRWFYLLKLAVCVEYVFFLEMICFHLLQQLLLWKIYIMYLKEVLVSLNA